MRSIASRAFILPALAILSGCSYNQVSAQGVTPIPQSLVEAAERTSQSTMALADIMARAHGESVRSVSLEVPSTGIPEFLMQRVRLDYNGPQKQVLERVAADTGYRVVEYNEPASGIGWQPWIRLSGDKPLVQHFKEMNSQSPWHIILDHRDRRIVVDYSADGSMASQVAAAQRALDNPKPQAARKANLPDTASINEAASRQITRDTVPAPESSARQARPETSEASFRQESWKNVLPLPGKGYWHALVSGYGSRARAGQMEEWIGAHRYQAMVVERGGQYDVHVPATDDGQAAAIVRELKDLGVPADVKYIASNGRNRNVDIPPLADRKEKVDDRKSVLPSSQIKNGELDPEAWYVQTAYVRDSTVARKAADTPRFDHLGHYDAYPLENAWVVRIGPLKSRDEAVSAMREVRESGISDAYAVRGYST